jgi:hypothetical protein
MFSTPLANADALNSRLSLPDHSRLRAASSCFQGNFGAAGCLLLHKENEMAMLSARFQDAAAAQRVVEVFITRLGAAPDLVIASPEGGQPSAGADAANDRSEPTAVPPVDSIRVSIHDTAIDNGVARDALVAGGGFDIRPVQ